MFTGRLWWTPAAASGGPLLHVQPGGRHVVRLQVWRQQAWSLHESVSLRTVDRERSLALTLDQISHNIFVIYILTRTFLINLMLYYCPASVQFIAINLT